MSKTIKIKDYLDLYGMLEDEVGAYEFPEETASSLLSAIVFQVAAFNDELMGTDHHENIVEYLDRNLTSIYKLRKQHQFSFILEIRLGVGKAHIEKLKKLDIKNKKSLKIVIERMLGVRNNYGELTNRTFPDIFARRKGIKSVRVSSEEDPKDKDWQLLELSEEVRTKNDMDVLCELLIKNHENMI